MRILFIQPTGDKRGHYGYWTSKLCQAIAKQGHELTLVTNKIYPERYLSDEIQFKVIEVDHGKHRFDRYDRAMEKKSLLYWYGYFKSTYLIVKHALTLCRHEKFDAIFITDVEYLIASLLLKQYKTYLTPVIWHVQAANFSYEAYPGSRLKKIYKLFQRRVFKSTLNHEVKGFAVLGEFHKQKLKEQLQLHQEFSVEIIPDGADILNIAFDQREARENIGLAFSGTVFLFLGVLRKDKGLEWLIEAASYVKNQNFKIIVAGAPFDWTAEELKSILIQRKVSSIVELRPGYVSDEQMPSYYFASDAVIFPYTRDYVGGCGPLTKGASTYGRPVIVSDVADLGRMVRQYKNGLIAQPNDAVSLAEQMMNFMRLSSQARQAMIENAHYLAKEHSWNNVAQRFTAFCQDVCLCR